MTYALCMEREFYAEKVLRKSPRLAIAALGGILASGLIGHSPPQSNGIFSERPGMVDAPPGVARPAGSAILGVPEGPNECTGPMEALSERLRRSSVLISSDEALGSGIIIASGGGETVILTNRHVVESESRADDGSPLLSPGMVVYNDGKLARVKSVRIAPNALDLAVVTVEGDLGPAVSTSVRGLSRGNRLMILGAPLGYEDSVTAGIVSNFSARTTDSGFRYIAIQTDAAINPGNSGGGFFLAGTGELVGITAFKLRLGPHETAEGMGFAIPIRYIYDFPYRDWQALPERG